MSPEPIAGVSKHVAKKLREEQAVPLKIASFLLSESVRNELRVFKPFGECTFVTSTRTEAGVAALVKRSRVPYRFAAETPSTSAEAPKIARPIVFMIDASRG